MFSGGIEQKHGEKSGMGKYIWNPQVPHSLYSGNKISLVIPTNSKNVIVKYMKQKSSQKLTKTASNYFFNHQ